MSDLDNLMNKLRKKENPKQEIVEKAEEYDDDEEEIDEEEEFDDEDEDEGYKEDKKKAEKSRPIHEKPQLKEKNIPVSDNVEENNNNPEHNIEQEVVLFHNDGIFRRELLLALKELVDVQKINAQILIEIKKKFDNDDGESKKNTK